jgi:predicted GIY-YIG superfamily endonuclease
MGFVYLIKLSHPVGRCLYYLGSTNDITRRWKEHVSGHGSPLLREALRRCIPFEIIAVQAFIQIQDARAFESRLKRWKNNRLALRILPPWGVVTAAA